MNALKTSQSDTSSVTSLGRSQDVNLNVFHKIGFYEKFSIVSDAKCIPDIAKKSSMSYFGPIMVWGVLTKIGPQRDVLETLCAGWVVQTQLL